MGDVAGGDEGAETPFGDSGSRNSEKIFVSVRLRPLNATEIARSDVSDWDCVSDNTIIYKNGSISGAERSMHPSAYTFDRVFGCDSSTRQVYQDGAKDVALSVVSGINASVFAYGQTSSGKTFTMTGITEYTLADIYDYVQKHTERDFHLKFSAMEIYNESVRDLLSADSSPLRLLDDPERGTIVEKLIEETVRDWDHVLELLSICEAQRKIGETSLNETSSRSHQILRLTVESSARNYHGRDGSSTFFSTVDFIDLAGSERASQSLSAGTRLKEGCHINRSLLTLGTVIRKLSKGRSGHIPFRDSKLTRILQSSLGGNARTAIICTMSPARSHVEQSRNTLLFASCAKEVSTNAQVNLVMSDKALVKHLQRELIRLESELKAPGSTYMTPDTAALLREKDLQIETMQRRIEELIVERDVARSQVQDLLNLDANDGNSLIRLSSDDYPHLRVKRSPAFENDIPETSAAEEPRSLDQSIRTFGSSQYSPRHSETSLDENYIHINELVAKSLPNSSPLRPAIRIADMSESDSCHEWDDVDDKSNGTSQVHCRVVRCIETEQFSSKEYEESYCSSPDEKVGMASLMLLGDDECANQEPLSSEEESLSTDLKEDREVNTSKAGKEGLHLLLKEDKITNEDKEASKENKEAKLLLEEDTEVVQPAVKEDRELESTPSNKYKETNYIDPTTISSPDITSQWSDFPQELPSTPSTGVKNVNSNTPSDGYEKDYAGRLQGLPTKISSFGNGVESETISRKGSQSSQGTINHHDVEARDSISTEEEEAEDAIVTAAKEPAERQDDKQVEEIQAEETADMTIQTVKTVKDVGLDPIEDWSKTSIWASQFKRMQREIIELWDGCNVSLVHRSYFFLLFNGDPTDLMYMEVERRRLFFLKDMFSRGNQAVEDGRTITRASSEKALRREREKLTKQMQKKLTQQERESLFLRWGIKLNSRYRRIQLANRVWSKIDDMDHIADSAVVVAKLVGFLTDPGQVPKEMFGLNFDPQPARKGYSFKRSLVPLL